MCEKLKAVGFSEVTMLSKPTQPAEATETASREPDARQPAARGVAA
jgi:hypothetical protein